MTYGVIHQPHFLPWLGYFNKLANTDVFISQDNVQFRRRYFQNRTIIQNSQGNASWFTLPVNAKRHSIIKDVKIVDFHWHNRLLKILKHSYSKADYFKENYPLIADMVFKTENEKYIADINMILLAEISKIFDLNYDVYRQKNYEKTTSPPEDLINLCKKTNIDSYIFGEGGGLTYHGYYSFKKAKISFEQQSFLNKLKKNINNDFLNHSIIHFILVNGITTTESMIKDTWQVEKDIS